MSTTLNFFNLRRLLFLTLAMVVAFSLLLPTVTKAQTVEADLDLSEEVVIDESVSAEDLGVDDQAIIEGGQQSFWNRFKESAGIFFTFNQQKKATKILNRAQKRLLEAKNLLASDDPSVSSRAAQRLRQFQRDMTKAQARLKDIREEVDESPELNNLLDRLIDRQLKGEKLLDRLAEERSGLLEEIEEIKDQNLEGFARVMQRFGEGDEITERLTKIVDRQKGSSLRGVKALTTLQRLEDKVPEQAKEAIQKAREKIEQQLVDNLEDLPADRREEIVQSYFRRSAGNKVRHLELLENLEDRDDLPEDVREALAKAKEANLARVREELADLPEEKQERMLNYLADGELNKLHLLKVLEDNVETENLTKIKELKERNLERFKQKLESAETDEAKQELFHRLKGRVKDIDLLEELEDVTPEERKEEVLKAREEVLEKMKLRLKLASPEDQAKILKRLSSDEPRHLEILRRVESRLPEESKDTIRRLIEASEVRLKTRLENADDPEIVERLKLRLEKNEGAKKKFEERFGNLDDRLEELKDKAEKRREKQREKFEKAREKLNDRLERDSELLKKFEERRHERRDEHLEDVGKDDQSEDITSDKHSVDVGKDEQSKDAEKDDKDKRVEDRREAEKKKLERTRENLKDRQERDRERLKKLEEERREQRQNRHEQEGNRRDELRN